MPIISFFFSVIDKKLIKRKIFFFLIAGFDVIGTREVDFWGFHLFNGIWRKILKSFHLQHMLSSEKGSLSLVSGMFRSIAC